MAVRTLSTGFSPITFNNEDLPGLRPVTPFTTLLDRLAELGYEGTERGAGFPEPEVARAACSKRKLTLVGAWCGLSLVAPDSLDADLAQVRSVARYVQRASGKYVNLAHAGNPERRAAAGLATNSETPRLSPSEWLRVASRLNRAGELCRELGVEATFHPHAGTWVETRAEVDQLMQLTDPALVNLCFDLGHAIVGGMDPLETLVDHAARVKYIHVKDVSPEQLAELRREVYGFERALRGCLFTEVGQGLLDLPGLARTLDKIDYSGWLMVEQDTTKLAPETAAAMARVALARVGLVDLKRGR